MAKKLSDIEKRARRAATFLLEEQEHMIELIDDMFIFSIDVPQSKLVITQVVVRDIGYNDVKEKLNLKKYERKLVEYLDYCCDLHVTEVRFDKIICMMIADDGKEGKAKVNYWQNLGGGSLCAMW